MWHPALRVGPGPRRRRVGDGERALPRRRERARHRGEEGQALRRARALAGFRTAPADGARRARCTLARHAYPRRPRLSSLRARERVHDESASRRGRWRRRRGGRGGRCAGRVRAPRHRAAPRCVDRARLRHVDDVARRATGLPERPRAPRAARPRRAAALRALGAALQRPVRRRRPGRGHHRRPRALPRLGRRPRAGRDRHRVARARARAARPAPELDALDRDAGLHGRGDARAPSRRRAAPVGPRAQRTGRARLVPLLRSALPGLPARAHGSQPRPERARAGRRMPRGVRPRLHAGRTVRRGHGRPARRGPRRGGHAPEEPLLARARRGGPRALLSLARRAGGRLGTGRDGADARVRVRLDLHGRRRAARDEPQQSVPRAELRGRPRGRRGVRDRARAARSVGLRDRRRR